MTTADSVGPKGHAPMFTPALPADLNEAQAHQLAARFLEDRRLRHGSARMDAGAGDPPAGDPPAGDPPASSAPAGKTFTEAELEAIIGKRLTREREAAERKVADANRTADQRLADLERELATERTARTRLDVATRHGIADLADVLAGNSADELEASAKRIADKLAVAKPAGDPPKGRPRTRSASSSSSSLKEPANPQGLDKKAQALEALRGLSGRSVASDA